MSQLTVSKVKHSPSSRRDERMQIADRRKELTSTQKSDAVLREDIYHAFWKDNVLRTIEYHEIDVHVKNGDVVLSGHIVTAGSKSLIEETTLAVAGVHRLLNDLVFDDELSAQVAASLEKLEHTHRCRIFALASHGVISLNGFVSNENVKLLAEQSVAGNPNVRGVVNDLVAPGEVPDLQEGPFLQPGIGQNIYFLDGVFGVVKQVIINPNNRCVIAMAIERHFEEQSTELKTRRIDDTRPRGQALVLPMMAVRYLTRVSGFLDIHSNEKNRYMNFDPAHFFKPKRNWKPPYPYGAEDVLFPVNLQDMQNKILDQLYRYSYSSVLDGQTFKEELATNDSLGG
jgi:osmotically-inducible protein OsmY